MERFPKGKTLNFQPFIVFTANLALSQWWALFGKALIKMMLFLSFLQVQGFHISTLQAASLSGVVPGREGGDASPPGGQEGKSCVLELHWGLNFTSDLWLYHTLRPMCSLTSPVCQEPFCCSVDFVFNLTLVGRLNLTTVKCSHSEVINIMQAALSGFVMLLNRYRATFTWRRWCIL